MAIISLEHQKQLGRQLGRLRQNAPEAAPADESAENSGQMSAVGTASFIMLGGFALLKDIFDFVFLGQSWATRAAGTAGQVGAGLEYAGYATMLYTWWTGKGLALGALINRLGWGVSGAGSALSHLGSILDAEKVIMPFLFTTMFMIIVVAVLLLSGTGLQSYKIFLNARFIGASFAGFFAEIIPVLNVLPWTAIFVVFLYFYVKKELKKQATKAQIA
jgi:hypothetical protein